MSSLNLNSLQEKISLQAITLLKYAPIRVSMARYFKQFSQVPMSFTGMENLIVRTAMANNQSTSLIGNGTNMVAETEVSIKQTNYPIIQLRSGISISYDELRQQEAAERMQKSFAIDPVFTKYNMLQKNITQMVDRILLLGATVPQTNIKTVGLLNNPNTINTVSDVIFDKNITAEQVYERVASLVSNVNITVWNRSDNGSIVIGYPSWFDNYLNTYYTLGGVTITRTLREALLGLEGVVALIPIHQDNCLLPNGNYCLFVSTLNPEYVGMAMDSLTLGGAVENKNMLMDMRENSPITVEAFSQFSQFAEQNPSHMYMSNPDYVLPLLAHYSNKMRNFYESSLKLQSNNERITSSEGLVNIIFDGFLPDASSGDFRLKGIGRIYSGGMVVAFEGMAQTLDMGIPAKPITIKGVKKSPKPLPAND